MNELYDITRDYSFSKGHYRIKTYGYEQRINDEVFKKFYILDLRKIKEEDLKAIFEEFSTLQDELAQDDYFSKAAHNLYIYFLCDDKKKLEHFAYEATRDIRYAFKQIINKEELSLIFDNNKNLKLDNTQESLNINNKNIIIDNFNLIYGRNGSGKTVLLNEIGASYGVTPANMMIIPERKEINLSDSIYLHSFISEEKNKYDYFLYLMSIIRYAKNNNTPILIDDMCWNVLDDINQIKLATILNEASFDNRVFVTAAREQVKSLIKATVYHPNIIEL